MDCNTAHNIRRVLASNLQTFAARGRDYCNRPFSYSIESLQNYCSRCVGEANFCFQIDALDADSYIATRDAIFNLTSAVVAVRKAVKDNHDLGEASDKAIEQISLLYNIVYLLKCGEASTTVNA